jgi:hypothetical protein
MPNYHNICSNIILIEMCESYILLENLSCQQLVFDTVSIWKTYILWQGFKINCICGTFT